MKPGLFIVPHPSSPTCPFPSFTQFYMFARFKSTSFLIPSSCRTSLTSSNFILPHRCFTKLCATNFDVLKSTIATPLEKISTNGAQSPRQWKVEVRNSSVASGAPPPKLSVGGQAFFLLAFIACTMDLVPLNRNYTIDNRIKTSMAFTSLVFAAVPTLHAMARVATSLSKLADTAREELPSTTAAIRLSGMEISDLTLELSDLSQEIADGVSKSAQVVQAAEAGVWQIGSLAREKTISMIEERASLPIISLQPVVVGAAKKTCRAVGEARKTFMSIISQGEFSSENEDSGRVDNSEN